MKKQKPAPNQPVPPLSAHVVIEELPKKRFGDLLEAEHGLGSRQPKGRTRYQLVCRGERWIGLSLWTATLWDFKSRDQRIGWDPCGRRIAGTPVPRRFQWNWQDQYKCLQVCE